jgi:CRISPR-associated protein Cas2
LQFKGGDDMFYVVAYDMPDTKRRNRLMKVMKGFGVHTQYSVFECELDDKEHDRMVRTILKIIDPGEDDVKIYRLCRDCLHSVTVIGVGMVAEEPDAIII